MTDLDPTPPSTAPLSPQDPGPPNRDTRSLGFPVVGIGASAGGLHAFQEVLTHLPVDTGMAFVLIPHLDPTHESMMVPILSKSTRMPVKEVTEGLGVESNHVYVIPPNATMILEGGILRLVPRSKVKHECIDYFMISLANELAGKAIGVVLSGTASDGTEGCTAIKAEGGITFAQDEASAKFPQMPKNAVAAGCIDVVLPPKRIAEELALVSRHPYLATSGTPVDEESPAGQAQDRQVMSKVFRLLRSATGVDFAHYKQGTIRRRLNRRMALRKSQGLNQYFRFLEENPSEVRALHDEVLINVTSFFRDPETYESLKQNVFPRIARKETGDTVRVWVAGCATGEEPYSIAMAFLEYLAETGLSIPMQIFATDLSDKPIAKARAGVYGAGIKADVSEERLRRFFSPTVGGEYHISKAIRDLCVFAKQDLSKDPPFSRQDLVSCRNVLIYMDSTLQDRVITSFHYALKPTGFLVLGTSESVDRFPHLFESVDKKSKIYSKIHGRQTQARLPVDTGDRARAPAGPELKLKLPETPGMFDLPKEVDRLILDRYVPSGIVVNEAGIVVQFRGDTSPYLRPPSGMPSFSLAKMVREDLFLDVETALQEAREKKVRVRKEGVRLQSEGRDRAISIEVMPILGPGVDELHFVIVFEEAPPVPKNASAPPPPSKPATALTALERENVRLKEELAASKRFLQSVVDRLESMNDDLRSANEEAVSSNEELLSTNEEIETAKEELQSGNEELNTLNDELQLRNTELGQVNSDWMNLIGSVNMAIAIVDQDLRFRRFTPPAENLLNVIPSDIGRRITDFKINLKAPDLEKSIRHVIESLATTEEEIEDTGGRWYSMRIRPYRTLDDKIAGAVIVWIDIHGLKVAMKQLEQTHALTDGIVETVRDPLIVLDSELRVKKVNRAFHEFFRLTNEQAVGRPITELGNGKWDIPALRELLIKLRDEDAIVSDFEITQQFQSIGWKTMLVNARRLRFSAPDEQLILMAMEDVTERRVRERFAEASVLASQTLDLDSLLMAVAHLAAQNIGDWACVYILEEDGSIRRAGLAHRDPARLIPIEAMLQRFPAGFDGSLGRGEGATLRTGKSSVRAEIQDSDLKGAAEDDDHLRLLGLLGPKSAMSVPLVVRGKTIGVLSVFNDQSPQHFGADELALAEELALRTCLAVDNARHYRSAQQAIREREQFISIASHEFKTPLSVLQLQTDALLMLARKKEIPLTAPHVEMIEKIGRQTERMADLVNNLLDVSAITTGKLRVHPEEMDLRASVLAVLTRIEEVLSRNKVKVTMQGDHPVRGRWDWMRIEQVITNLLTNAVKYGNGKPITVTVAEERSKAILTVQDHGIGIPPEAKPKLFKPYERFSPQSSTGLGLGLFIVRQVVEAHGGTIRVTSEVGHGTTFVIELPIGDKPTGGGSETSPS